MGSQWSRGVTCKKELDSASVAVDNAENVVRLRFLILTSLFLSVAEVPTLFWALRSLRKIAVKVGFLTMQDGSIGKSRGLWFVDPESRSRERRPTDA
jgi:hypothetical protein